LEGPHPACDYKKRWRAIACQISNEEEIARQREKDKGKKGLHVKVGKGWNKSRDEECLSRRILTREKIVGENWN